MKGEVIFGICCVPRTSHSTSPLIFTSILNEVSIVLPVAQKRKPKLEIVWKMCPISSQNLNPSLCHIWLAGGMVASWTWDSVEGRVEVKLKNAASEARASIQVWMFSHQEEQALLRVLEEARGQEANWGQLHMTCLTQYPHTFNDVFFCLNKLKFNSK